MARFRLFGGSLTRDAQTIYLSAPTGKVTVLFPALLTLWHTNFIVLASTAHTLTVSSATTSTVADSLPALETTDGKRSFDAGTYLSTSPMNAHPP
jgi:hypothetical protein